MRAEKKGPENDEKKMFTLRLQNGLDDTLHVSDTATCLYRAIAERLQKPEGLIQVLHGGELVEPDITVAESGIEDGATLSVLEDEEALLAMKVVIKKMKKLGFQMCTLTKISYERDSDDEAEEEEKEEEEEDEDEEDGSALPAGDRLSLCFPRLMHASRSSSTAQH